MSRGRSTSLLLAMYSSSKLGRMGSSNWISVHDLMPHELSARIFRFENADLAEANQCSADDDKQWIHPTIDHIMLASPGQALCDELRERL